MSANPDESLIGPLTPSDKKAPVKPLITDNGRHPGPWRMDERGVILAEPRPGTISEVAGCVASVYSPNNSVGIANGRLITAAPDLLVACEAALKGHGKVHEDSCTIGPDNKTCTCHVALLERAVAKATGAG